VIALLSLNFCKDIQATFVQDIKSLHSGNTPVNFENDRKTLKASVASQVTSSNDPNVQNNVKLCIEKYKSYLYKFFLYFFLIDLFLLIKLKFFNCRTEVLKVGQGTKIDELFNENIPSISQLEEFEKLKTLKEALSECQGVGANSEKCEK
jgi:hypothetical protein